MTPSRTRINYLKLAKLHATSASLDRARRSHGTLGVLMAPALKIMGRLGLACVTAVMTLCSALLSTFIAWLFSFVIHVPNYDVHIFLAFVIPFLVTPTFGFVTALSIQDLQRARKRASDLARLDALTGIGNRRAFFDEAKRRAEQPGLCRKSQGVLFIDIDHFKSINDRYGHEAGDSVLKHFTELLLKCARKDDIVARVGGEEFVVLIEDIDEMRLATIAAGIVARARMSPACFVAAHIQYTVSIGGAITDMATSVDVLLSIADKQLYIVKNGGRDNYLIIDVRHPEPPSTLRQRRTTLCTVAFPSCRERRPL
jgi:diguanylate cyclase (GGDEF)-like protein